MYIYFPWELKATISKARQSRLKAHWGAISSKTGEQRFRPTILFYLSRGNPISCCCSGVYFFLSEEKTNKKDQTSTARKTYDKLLEEK